jgi:hypothetical protein
MLGWWSTSDGICEENKRGGRIVIMNGIVGSLVVLVEQDTVSLDRMVMEFVPLPPLHESIVQRKGRKAIRALIPRLKYMDGC